MTNKEIFEIFLRYSGKSVIKPSRRAEKTINSYVNCLDGMVTDCINQNIENLDSLYNITNITKLQTLLNSILKVPSFKAQDSGGDNMYSAAFKKYIDYCKFMQETQFDPSEIIVNPQNKSPLQRIYYGAPGTGKSNEIKELTGKGKGDIKFGKNFIFRTTFHPDSDYASFVGSYKPIWDDEKRKIRYEFRPQAFIRAYIAAWTNPDKNVALVIEEINRGNCSQIFGDIFQLLDRENTGLSTYPIETDIDMSKFIEKSFTNKDLNNKYINLVQTINGYYQNHHLNAFDKIIKGEILVLPRNLSILATMNTSDQSLFPMDSAFKRRWDWKYIPIVNAAKNWKIELDNDHELIDWWEFLKRINTVIGDLTTSEDKKLGYFFCQPDKSVAENGDGYTKCQGLNVISAERFVEKVIFYLWNDVFKDYSFDANCCKDKNNKEVLFAQFFEEDGKSVNTVTLTHFFETLKDNKEDSLVVSKGQANADNNPSLTADIEQQTEESEEAETETDNIND